MMRSIRKNEDAFTGLEAAIVLIAFVVVAAVFSYVVLGAGFFTTQKSQETVHSGVAMASSAVEVLGDVYGISADNVKVDTVQFTLGLAAGATSVDINKTAMVLTDGKVVETLTNKNTGSFPATVAAGQWGIKEALYELGTSNLMLEKGEQFVIQAKPNTAVLNSYTQFNLEVRPPVGTALGIKRTVPASVGAVNLLY